MLKTFVALPAPIKSAKPENSAFSVFISALKAILAADLIPSETADVATASAAATVPVTVVGAPTDPEPATKVPPRPMFKPLGDCFIVVDLPLI